MATTGIAALLLDDGNTAHSTLKIPLSCNDQTVCGFKIQSNLADLIRKAEIFIWDEAPTANKYTFESQRLPVANYKAYEVNELVAPVLNLADYTIRLQDLINSNGSILTEILSTPAMNSKQLTFLQTWKQLHPPELLSKIGINL
jgi:hypothetical protein